MKFVKIVLAGGRAIFVGKLIIEVPVEILLQDEYPINRYYEDTEVVGDIIFEEEWEGIINMVKAGKRFSGIISHDEYDIVVGLDESDYGQMKQVMLDCWEDPKYYNNPTYGRKLIEHLDNMEWNDEMVNVPK